MSTETGPIFSGDLLDRINGVEMDWNLSARSGRHAQLTGEAGGC